MSDGRTHQVAVIGYLVRDGRFLLLKRTTPPRVWAPPGGRLEPDEDPLEGLRREVREETSLSVEIMAPVETWFGRLTGERPMLSINYLCRPGEGAVRLSAEHDDWAWVSLAGLESGTPPYLHPEIGFQLANFRAAWRVYKAFPF